MIGQKRKNKWKNERSGLKAIWYEKILSNLRIVIGQKSERVKNCEMNGGNGLEVEISIRWRHFEI